MRYGFMGVFCLGLSFIPLITYADAEMFKPFEAYLDGECGIAKPCCKSWNCFQIRREKYCVNREARSEYWRQQKHFNRHCGSAYVNCIDPAEDYPRYNGPPVDVRIYQRKPYYFPFR